MSLATPDHCETIIIPGGELYLWPHFLGALEAFRLFALLRRETAWEQSIIRIGGRQIPIPRLNAWIGDFGAYYSYSGISLATRPWSQPLRGIKARVEAVTGVGFNSALLNLYRNERDSVDWHSDDEVELGAQPRVASVSLGESRCFELRRRDDHRHKLKLDLPAGSLLLMDGDIQHQWQHRIGKEKYPCAERINITFRSVHNSEGTDSEI